MICYICQADCRVTSYTYPSFEDNEEVTRVTVFCPVHGMIETKLHIKKKGGDKK